MVSFFCTSVSPTFLDKYSYHFTPSYDPFLCSPGFPCSILSFCSFIVPLFYDISVPQNKKFPLRTLVSICYTTQHYIPQAISFANSIISHSYYT
jgi:hypothetical protein